MNFILVMVVIKVIIICYGCVLSLFKENTSHVLKNKVCSVFKTRKQAAKVEHKSL